MIQTIFLENPTYILAFGAVLVTLAALVFWARRNLPSLFALLGVVLFTLLLVLVERVIVTEREEVETAVYQLTAAVEANNLPAVLALLDPTAIKPCSDAQTLLPRLKIAKAHVGGKLSVDVDSSAMPHQATSRFRALLDAVDNKSGMKFVYFDEVEISWIRKDDRWLVTDYSVKFQEEPSSEEKSPGVATPGL